MSFCLELVLTSGCKSLFVDMCSRALTVYLHLSMLCRIEKLQRKLGKLEQRLWSLQP